MFWVLLLIVSPLNVYSLDKCGVPLPRGVRTRVVVGTKSLPGAFPWAASLMYCLRNEMPSCQTHRDFGWCGGTLINNRQVLTAAHCVQRFPPDEFTVDAVTLGSVRLDENQLNGLIYFVDKVIVHPDYEYLSPAPVGNDIALITLREVVEFTQFIKPVCLPSSADLIVNNFVGYNPFVAGWGSTKDLEGIDYPRSHVLIFQQIPVVNRETCQSYYNRPLWESHICAGGRGNSACTGDSGSALVQPNLGYYYIIGIVSYGYSCRGDGNPIQPSVYTRITSYIDWIMSNSVGGVPPQ